MKKHRVTHLDRQREEFRLNVKDRSTAELQRDLKATSDLLASQVTLLKQLGDQIVATRTSISSLNMQHSVLTTLIATRT